MEKIELPQSCSSHCYDCIFYSLLKYYNHDYKAYALKYFYTDYIVPAEGLGNVLTRGKYYNHHRYIFQNVYNISITSINIEDPLIIVETICSLSKEYQVIIDIDPYYCYWTTFYNRSHINHAILILDIDYLNNEFICFDVYFNSVGYIKLSFETVKRHCKELYKCNFKTENELIIDSLLRTVYNSTDSFEDNLSRKKLELINYFLLNEQLITSLKDIETSMLLINLLWISEDKKNFSIGLRYLEEKVEKLNFSTVYGLLESSSQHFYILRSLIIKSSITGQLKKEKLKEIVDQLLEMDALTVLQLKSVLNRL